ncbi:MAG: AarF/ABC1/UbiB kinase family protein [Woeseiaceae bacterium]|nr:AarF/ABC1/UbiB kinase family protein [Woeseiaceae bacterium]
MSRDELNTSAFGRFVRVGGLVGRVGVSMLSDQAVGLLRDGPTKRLKKAENLVRNATRIASTLGEMKGAAMKVGQMLSLHEGLLPKEVAAVLSVLQNDAPSVSFDVMEGQLRSDIDNFDDVFESIETEAFASASIGQVHRGTLRDGREVAVKIQYPDADRMVTADLTNMKVLLGNLVGLFTDIDFDPIWEEVKERLVEELDYLQEAENIRRKAEMHADFLEIIIPDVIGEATTRHVLTMEFVEAIPPNEAASDRYPQELKDQWAATLFEFTLRGLFKHKFLHADPNFANFAFREDGTVAVYDYGCMKQVPDNIATGYAGLMDALLKRRKSAFPELLQKMGVHREGGEPLSRTATDPYVDLMQDIVRASPPYTFGEDETIYKALYDLGMTNWQEASDIRFPRDMVFIDRTLGGLFGNLGKLGATGPWRKLLQEYTAPLLVT